MPNQHSREAYQQERETIREENEEYLHRVPLEATLERLVRGMRDEFRREEQKIMATLADDEAADARYKAAVEARDAREKAVITTQAATITDQAGQIVTLTAGEVPDAVVQAKLDLAAAIEAENAAAAGPAEGPGGGAMV